MKARTLLAQVLAVNLLLVAGTMLLATIAVDERLTKLTKGREVIVLALAVIATLLGNWLLLHRRFTPLDELISSMEKLDLTTPQRPQVKRRPHDSTEVKRLQSAYDRMMTRLDAQRREAGRAAIQAQERERRRIGQDLHDEVNQALTAVSLRLQATIERSPEELRRELTETKGLATQAMEELLALAGQLRPAVLDDHGLLAALHSQVRDFADQTGIGAKFNARGTMPWLSPDQQLVVYRVTQESLSNVAQHSGARNVDVELSFVGRTLLRITDDGLGFAQARNGGLGLSGMRERALLVGGNLSIRSTEGDGTRVELVIG